MHILHEVTIFGQLKNNAKTLFFHPRSPFPCNYCKGSSIGIFYCSTILDSTSIAMHNVKQCLHRNWLGSGSCNLLRLLVWKITKCIHSCKPAHADKRCTSPLSGQFSGTLSFLFPCKTSFPKDNSSSVTFSQYPVPFAALYKSAPQQRQHLFACLASLPRESCSVSP